MAKRNTQLALSTYNRTARAYTSLFLGRENVKFISLGLKEKAGQMIDQLAIKIYVGEKIKESELDNYELLPKEVKALTASGKALQSSIPIDVVAIGKGKFSLLGIKGSDSFHIDGVNIQGTCAIADSDGYVYTNAHVAAIHNGRPISPGSPVMAVFRSTKFSGDIIKISDLQPVGNRMDAAIMKLAGFEGGVDDWNISAVQARVISPVAPLVGSGVFEYFSGNDHIKLVTPELAGHQIRFTDMNGNEYGFEGFYMLQVEENSPQQPRPGHSGSMLLKHDESGWHPAGLVFGLAEFSQRILVCVYDWEDVISWNNSKSV